MEKEGYLNDAFAVFERRLDEFEALSFRKLKLGISIKWLSHTVKC